MTGAEKRVLRAVFRNGATDGSDLVAETGLAPEVCSAACLALLASGQIEVHGVGVMATGIAPPEDEEDDPPQAPQPG